MSSATSPASPPDPSNGSEHAHAHLVRPRLKRARNRRAFAFATTFALLAAFLLVYKYYNRPIVVQVAVADHASGDVAALSAYARFFAQIKAPLRMSVHPYKSRGELERAFLEKRVDVAVVRAEANLQGRGAVVAVMRKAVGVVIALAPEIVDIPGLRGKRVGVMSVDGAADSFLAALLQTYEIADSEISLVRVAPEDLPLTGAAGVIDALVTVAPLSHRPPSEALRAMLRTTKAQARLLPIDRADDLTRRAPALESFTIPARSFMQLPEADAVSVAMPINLVAQSTMSNDAAAALARQILSNKQAVTSEAPSVAEISAPATNKDAFVPIHPGVAAYIDNEELTFFDKYGDLVYIFMAIGGVFASGFVALRRSFGPDKDADACELIDELVDLRREARALAHAVEPAAIATRWREVSDRFEDMLAQALPLIADGGVGERTVHALSTALSAAERAIADLATLAFAAAAARRDMHAGGSDHAGSALKGAMRDL